MKSSNTAIGSKATIAVFVALAFGFPASLSFAQAFTEVISDGWGQGFDQAAPYVADIDGNGLLDVLVGTRRGNILHYRQRSAGSQDFDRTTYSLMDTVLSSESCVTAADIDGDGLLDLLVGGNSGEIYHYEQVQAGLVRFAGKNRNFLGRNFGAHCVPFLTDFDGDGILDLVITHSTGQVIHYRQESRNSETFVPGKEDLLPSLGIYPSLFFDDIDGDGLLDLLVPGNTHKIRHYRQDAVQKDTFLLVNDTFNNIQWIEHGTVFVYDIDGDNRLEMLTGDQCGRVVMYRQTASGSMDFGAPVDTVFLKNRDFGTNSAFTITDLDGNGLLDLLVAARIGSHTPPGRLHHLQQAAPGSLRFDLVTENFNGITIDSWPGICVYDIDGNGRLDLLIGDQQSRMKRYEQKASGSVEFELVDPLFNRGLDLPGNKIAPVITDLEGDGRLDMIIGASNGEIFHFVQNSPGDTLFTELTSSFSNIRRDYYPAPFFLRDPDSGKLLLLVGSYDGKTARYMQDETDPRTFQELGFIAELAVFGSSQPFAADVNGDGAPDFFIGDQAGGISLFLSPAPSGVVTPATPFKLTVEALFPQPASGTANVTLRTVRSGRVRVELLDVLGRVVANFADRDFTEAAESFKADLSGIPGGYYLLRASQGSEVAYTRLIIAP